MKTIIYTYRGGVERGRSGSYHWHNGYSETTPDGKVLYPWMTARECQQDAKAKGARAVLQDKSGKPMQDRTI